MQVKTQLKAGVYLSATIAGGAGSGPTDSSGKI
jgi:hypothetical protein